MKRTSLVTLLATLLIGNCPTTLSAQQTVDVDRTKYTDYTETNNPDWSLMTPARREGEMARARTRTQRPDHVNNAETKHFPPVFNQDGGSCGSASRISYMFSHEMAAYRDLDGSDPKNYYPSHFVWLHTNSPTSPIDQGKDAFVTAVGVPSAATYGGQTYSSTFGNQEESNEYFGWMQGYEKWFEAMHNRMLKPMNFPVSVATEEGREAVKNWLWNHNGDDDFAAGGICGIGVASACETGAIPKTATNEKIGLAGLQYVMHWGQQVDHALTIVGYDDRIEFDLDGNGVAGEVEKDEVGAWIIVNSWGPWWKNSGFVYCPYAKAMPTKNSTLSTSAWMPEIYRVRKDYRPLRTIKLEMDYSRRSEIALSAGISADINATEPEKTQRFVHFTYAGDGNYGNSNPAPEVPMLGRWADGKMHTEPMEFGYDLTDLTDGYDMSKPLKYFFVVESRSWAKGNGTIHNASIMDYRFDKEGIETPFGVGEGVEVKNAGGKTIISVIVQGSSYYAPQNTTFDGIALSWQAPMRSGQTVKAYRVYYGGSLITELASAVTSYAPQSPATTGEYGVSAVYADGNESDPAVARIPVAMSEKNVGIQFAQSGFTIPDVMATQHKQATIEFWIKPNSLSNWNQTGGPGWGTFMFHADANGVFTAGWATGDHRANSYTTLKIGVWTHVAIVVDKNKMTIYFNGERRGMVTSNTYSGVGGFGDLVFASSGNGAQDAVYDEIRIWNVVRTEAELKAYHKVEFTGNIMPKGLIAYLKGDLTTDEAGNQRLFDCAGGHHATLQGNYTVVDDNLPTLGTTTEAPTISISAPKGKVYAGIPVTLNATYNNAVSAITWTATGAGVNNLTIESPALTFATAGTHSVSATATSADGRTATATRDITVEDAPAPDASFTMTATGAVPAGERITFHVQNPQTGYTYQWSMPGATATKGASPSVATSYQRQGTYKVTLTVTTPSGAKASKTETIKVEEVAPEADFSISPAVILKGESVELNDKSLYTPLTRQWTISNGGNNYIVYADVNTVTMDQPGVYSVTLDVANNSGSSSITRERAIIVTNADSKNGLLFSSDASTVTANKVPFTTGQTGWTVEWWMNPQWPTDNTNGIGDSEETMIIRTMGGGKLQLCVGGKNIATTDGHVIAGEWHHYAVTFEGGKGKFYRDGELMRTLPLSSITAMPEMKAFRIGGSEAPFKGSIDELRVWGSVLSEERLRAHANAPIEDVAKAQANDNLVLYYNFNQSGGDVQDATSSANQGVRTGFGPDGDAWGLSRGVFCLNDATTKDITEEYLTNYAKSFTDDNKCINSNLPARTFGLTGWTKENAITSGSITTGAHVDREKSRCLTVTTGWDGFATTLNDHKVFQTITLPAGFYTLTAEYDATFEGQCGNSYLVAARGNTLPVTDNLDEALAYTNMKEKGTSTSNSLDFVLNKETTVSLGMLVNMSGMLCMTIQKFTLTQGQVTTFGTTQEIPDGIEAVTIETTAPKGIYDLMGRQVRGNSQWTDGLAPGIYIIDGRKTVVK